MVKTFDVQVQGAEAISNLATVMRHAGDEGKGLKKELSKGLRDAMKPMLNDARKRARSIPTSGTKSTGLRRELARATKLKVSLSARNPKARMFVDPNRLSFKSAANLMDGARKWRHPVFGDRTTWVEQQSHPFFTPAVKQHLGKVRDDLTQVLTDIGKKIEKVAK